MWCGVCGVSHGCCVRVCCRCAGYKAGLIALAVLAFVLAVVVAVFVVVKPRVVVTSTAYTSASAGRSTDTVNPIMGASA